MTYGKPTLLASILALSVGLATLPARADTLADIVAQLTADGYTISETNVGVLRSKVHARKDGVEREITIDRVSGTVVKDETGSDDGSDDSNDDGDDGSGGNGGPGGSGGNSGPGGSGGNSGPGGSGGSGGNSGPGGSSSASLVPEFDYLMGGLDEDVDFA
jgi:hypothetical protein